MDLTTYFFDLVEWLMALPPVIIYLFIFIIAYGENVIPPIPGDLAVVFGGYLVGLGMLNLGVTILISTIGGVLGFMTLYFVGYRWGEAVFNARLLRWISRKNWEKVVLWVQQYGYWLVVANRFLSGARSVISLSVGTARMKPRFVWLASGVSAFLWCTLLVLAGWLVGDQWQEIRIYLSRYSQILVGLISLILLIWGLKKWRTKRIATINSKK